MKKELIKLANHLDRIGRVKEANYIDNLLKKAENEDFFNFMPKRYAINAKDPSGLSYIKDVLDGVDKMMGDQPFFDNFIGYSFNKNIDVKKLFLYDGSIKNLSDEDHLALKTVYKYYLEIALKKFSEEYNLIDFIKEDAVRKKDELNGDLNLLKQYLDDTNHYQAAIDFHNLLKGKKAQFDIGKLKTKSLDEVIEVAKSLFNENPRFYKDIKLRYQKK